MSKSAIATPSPDSSMSSTSSGDSTSFGPLKDSSDEMDETPILVFCNCQTY